MLKVFSSILRVRLHGTQNEQGKEERREHSRLYEPQAVAYRGTVYTAASEPQAEGDYVPQAEGLWLGSRLRVEAQQATSHKQGRAPEAH